MPNQSSEKFCDIVMKGGITSGIVYPTAVAELAQHWSFKNIGGTSAGAIAAAATAAAQYGRRNSNPQAFTELAEVSTYLAQTNKHGKTRLRELFQPQAAAREALTVTLALLERSKWKAALTLLRCYPQAAGAGIIPGLALITLAWSKETSFLWLVDTLLGLLTACVGAVLMAGWWFIRDADLALLMNDYGFCRGYSARSKTELTNWLSALINRLAGLPESEPLTFGHLWSNDEKDRTINLEMMTTNLSLGRPQRLPFRQGGYFYSPKEFAEYFPTPVLTWMEKHSEPANLQYGDRPLRTLPAAKDLPVIVATRMSLSFPVLLSAVPLYVIDRSRRTETEVVECCWFSDGGICSNFPVHFFDGVLPTRPSFALNLKPFHEDFPNQQVYMPTSNRGGLLSGFSFIVTPGDFLKSVFGAMQNWNDSMQLPLPGYRDRIVHICLDEENEGGLNLNMSPDTIRKVAARGKLAADELIQRYALNSAIETNWENHRWIRLRSSLAQIEVLLKDLKQAYEHPMPGDKTYAELLHSARDEAPSYKWSSEGQRKHAQQAVAALLKLVEEWQASNHSLQPEAPKPQPELRIRPRL